MTDLSGAFQQGAEGTFGNTDEGLGDMPSALKK